MKTMERPVPKWQIFVAGGDVDGLQQKISRHVLVGSEIMTGGDLSRMVELQAGQTYPSVEDIDRVDVVVRTLREPDRYTLLRLFPDAADWYDITSNELGAKANIAQKLPTEEVGLALAEGDTLYVAIQGKIDAPASPLLGQEEEAVKLITMCREAAKDPVVVAPSPPSHRRGFLPGLFRRG